MAGEVKAFLDDYNAYMKKAQELSAGEARAFGGMFQALMKEGTLSVKVKELIALAIGVETRCEPCIYLHVEKCLHAGATPTEIMEATGVAVMMRGGPAYTQIPRVAKAIEELSE